MAETDAPFDVRIVNSLERPLIKDFNLAQAAQRTTSQALAGAVFAPDRRGSQVGFDKYAFANFGFRAEPTSPTTLAVKLTRGMGLGYVEGVADASIGGITGVNVSPAVPYFPLVMSEDRVIPVPPAPAAGKCRRDFIAVTAWKSPDWGLTDYTTTDIFNPAGQVFTPANKYKTLSFDYATVPLRVIAAGGATSIVPESPLIYIPGIETTYAGPSTFHTLATTGRSLIPEGYVLIAAINVEPEATTITDGHICDFRPILLANNSLTVPIKFRGGNQEAVFPSLPGDYLDFDSGTCQIPGIKTVLMAKVGGNAQNLYSVIIPGMWGLNFATGVAAVAGPLPAINVVQNGFETLAVTNYENSWPNDFASGSLLTAEQVAFLADPAFTMPARTLAVGQPYMEIKFAIGCLNWDYHRIDYSALTFGNDVNGAIHRVNVTGTLNLAY